MTKRELLKSILFCILFVAILIPLSYALRTNGDVKDRFVGFYAEPNNTIDVVFIGSSPVYGAFVTPKIWGEAGITSYALSSHVQRPVAAKYLVEEALKSQTPSLFVFEMRMFAMSDAEMMTNMAYTRGVTDNLKYSVNRVKLINALVPDSQTLEYMLKENSPTQQSDSDNEQNNPVPNEDNPNDIEEAITLDISDMERYTYYFDIFKYHSNWKTLSLWSQLRTCFYEYPDALKGYVPEYEIGSGTFFDIKNCTEYSPIPREQEMVLLDLLTYLNEKEIPALFVLIPESINTETAAKYNTIKKIVTDHGQDFLDMNEYYSEMSFDFSHDFKDQGGHLNIYGAEKMTSFFENYLLKNYSFSDKRGDSHYRSWDEAYMLWDEALKRTTFSEK